MKPTDIIHQVERDIASAEQRLARLRTLWQSLRTCYEWETAERTGRRPVKRRSTCRPKPPRRGHAHRVVKVSGRRTPLAPGSLGDRIVAVLTEFAAPMRKRPLVEAVKAPVDAVVSELRRLRAVDRVTVVGATSAARYAVPKFAHVIVAEDAA